MKKISYSTMLLAAASLAGPALAADLPVKARPLPVAAYSWTGCYVGASAGANAGHTDGFVTTPATVLPEVFGPIPINPNVNVTGAFELPAGVIAGGFGGCNYQFASRFVIGGEVDWSYTHKNSQRTLVPGGIAALGGFGNNSDLWSIEEHQLATARIRLGFLATDNWLLYVTGGGVWGQVETFETITTNPVPSESALQTHWRGGWTVGAGTEYALGKGWSVRGEFLYVDLGRWTTFTNIPNGIQGSDTFSNMSLNLREYVGRVGVAYKFGWPTGAVVAKY
jgi:outer membrane immunogenic protein